MTHNKIVSFFLVIILVFSCGSYCFANTKDTGKREVHVDDQVLTELESSGETYAVIWIEDIDHKELLKRVEENTGLTEHNLIFGDEKANTDLYISEKRRLGKEMCSAKVTAVVNDLQFPEEKMIYQGSYVPIIIAKITEDDLNKLKLHDKIFSVEYISKEELFATPQVDDILPSEEKEPLVLSLKGMSDSPVSVYSVSLRLSLDENMGTIDLTLHYNPEVLEWFPTDIIDVMPTPSIKLLSEGLLRVTLDCRKYSRNWESIVSASFSVRNGGDPQIYLTEAKVYDKNGKEMPLRIENTFENAKIISDITWRYAEEEDCLYIGGEGIICDYSYYDDDTGKSEVKTPWHVVGSKAKKAVIQEGITLVDGTTFDGFTQLESIEIADSVVKLPRRLLDDDEMNAKVVLRGKAPGPVELYSNKGFQFEPTNEVLRGDLNDDGQLTAADALRILQEAAQLEPKHRCTGDYNTDGQVTAKDALGVLREAAKL